MHRILFFLLFTSCLIAQGQDQLYIDSLRKQLGLEQDRLIKIQILHELSWELGPTHPQEAIRFARQALNLSAGKYPDMDATSYNRLGAAFDFTGDYDSAIFNFRESAVLREKLRDTIGLSNVLINIGASWYYQGVFSKALDNYRQAGNLKEIAGDQKGLSQVYNNIGLVYRVRKEYEKAEEYFRKSVEIKRSLNDHKGEINTLSNLGIVYQIRGKCEEAGFFAKAAYEKAIVHGGAYDVPSALTNLGFASLCEGNAGQALRYFQDAEKRLLELEDINTLAFCYKGMAEASLLDGKNENSITYSLKALQYGLQSGRKELIGEIYLILSKAQQNAGRHQQALENYQLHVSWKDSVYSVENARQLNEIEVIYKTGENEKVINRLSQERLLQEEQLKNSRMQRNWSLVVLFIAALFLLVVIYALIQKQKNNRELDRKNHDIETALKQKEILLREIHHRVKNNLQIINGLLELQESLHQNPELGNLVAEAQGRIKSMALIHEMLYQTSDLSAISLAGYLERLIEVIETGYSLKRSKVNVQVSGEDIGLNIDTIIPLGLMVNELVTNAYKYVFQPEKGSSLSIIISRKNNGFQMIVKDDGQGLPHGEDSFRKGSFGLKMVKMFARQLRGKVEYFYNNGAEFRIEFNELNDKA
jgi:two-component system, sensor histidine kinase PdtaS